MAKSLFEMVTATAIASYYEELASLTWAKLCSPQTRRWA